MSAKRVFDVVIVGGGIVGLATARELLKRGRGLRVAVVEKEARLAVHQSSRNSGVIHCGVYYKPGSEQAWHCTRGAQMMYDFCRRYNVPAERRGKLIVATNAPGADPAQRAAELRQAERVQRAVLDGRDVGEMSWQHAEVVKLFGQGQENGVPDLELLTREQWRDELEPHVEGSLALHCPSTGIVDFGQVCGALVELITQGSDGAEIITGFDVQQVEETEDGIALLPRQGSGHEPVLARKVVGASGLHADRLSQLFGGKPTPAVLPIKGSYYEIVDPVAAGYVHRNIYPTKDPRYPWLGVHLTPTATSKLLGPNAVVVPGRECYSYGQWNAKDLGEILSFPGTWHLAKQHWRFGLSEMMREFSVHALVRSLTPLFPWLRAEHVRRVPSRSGIRALALNEDGTMVQDFHFEQLAQGRALLVRNAPSPAATASLSIAEKVADMAMPA